MSPELLSPALAVALLTYTVGVASPGPSNMAIMGTAMSQGRSRALALAAGIVSGSLVWGFAAALGLSAVMRNYSWVLVILKVLGGFYLLLLSWRAARAALAPDESILVKSVGTTSKWRLFVSGICLHITNPKAIFVWLSIVAISLPPGAGREHAFLVVASCGVIGVAVFFGYAVVFSTAYARVAYAKAHRWFNAMLSTVYAIAGVKLLLARDAV